MEQDKKKSELLNFIREYRFVREEELMFHIQKSMEEVQSMCQKGKLSETIKVLLSALPLSVKERQTFELYKEFPTLVDESTPMYHRSIDCGRRIPVGVSLDETKIRLLLNLTNEHF